MSYFPLTRPARIAVMASGRGSNLEALLKAFPHDNPLGHIVLVISDKREALALQKAVEAGVEAEYVPWPRSRDQGVAYKTGREQFEQVAGQLLHDHRIDLILLAGFMRLLSPAFVQAWQGRILNIHPSLLPQFPGYTPSARLWRPGRRSRAVRCILWMPVWTPAPSCCSDACRCCRATPRKPWPPVFSSRNTWPIPRRCGGC